MHACSTRTPIGNSERGEGATGKELTMWINVKEKMPPSGKYVHIFGPRRHHIAYWMRDAGAWYTDSGGKIALVGDDPENARDITHWRPLCDPPD